VFERQSAIANALKAGGRDGQDGQRRLQVGEVRGWTLIQIAAFVSTVPEFEDAVRPVFQADLPKGVGEAVNVDGRRLLKTGSEQYWIFTFDGADTLDALQAAVTPNIGAITLLSDSRTCLFIDGEGAREVLARGIALDFHPEVFRIGHFALTGVHHTPVLVYRTGDNRYELYALRTFAVSVWEWLIDAALSFGYDIVASG
jgi:heterotetrameric sarcosine oxidase gamma subunit